MKQNPTLFGLSYSEGITIVRVSCYSYFCLLDVLKLKKLDDLSTLTIVDPSDFKFLFFIRKGTPLLFIRDRVHQ